MGSIIMLYLIQQVKTKQNIIKERRENNELC
nr:MAG TPA: hypothetical protein [Caudoviricetes sp.]